jgi:hypothetical protein
MCFGQMMFALGTGAPIFVLFPLLIYGSKAQNALTSRMRRLKRRIALRFTEGNRPAAIALPNGLGRSHRVPSVFSEWEGSIEQREFKRSLYWRHRFVFAVLLWMSFVSFISADFAMQAAPIPGIACFLTESNEWILKADPSLFCFSGEMGRSHLAGALLAFTFTIVFPFVIYSKINRISNLQLWDNTDCLFQMGYFYGPLKMGWCYLSIMNHLQLCVLVTVFDLVFWRDEMAMVVATMSLNLLYAAVTLFGRPYESWLDNILEAIFYTICAFGFGLSLLQMHDPEHMLIEVRTARNCCEPQSHRAYVLCSQRSYPLFAWNFGVHVRACSCLHVCCRL